MLKNWKDGDRTLKAALPGLSHFDCRVNKVNQVKIKVRYMCTFITSDRDINLTSLFQAQQQFFQWVSSDIFLCTSKYANLEYPYYVCDVVYIYITHTKMLH